MALSTVNSKAAREQNCMTARHELQCGHQQFQHYYSTTTVLLLPARYVYSIHRSLTDFQWMGRFTMQIYLFLLPKNSLNSILFILLLSYIANHTLIKPFLQTDYIVLFYVNLFFLNKFY